MHMTGIVLPAVLLPEVKRPELLLTFVCLHEATDVFRDLALRLLASCCGDGPILVSSEFGIRVSLKAPLASGRSRKKPCRIPVSTLWPLLSVQPAHPAVCKREPVIGEGFFVRLALQIADQIY